MKAHPPFLKPMAAGISGHETRRPRRNLSQNKTLNLADTLLLVLKVARGCEQRWRGAIAVGEGDRCSRVTEPMVARLNETLHAGPPARRHGVGYRLGGQRRRRQKRAGRGGSRPSNDPGSDGTLPASAWTSRTPRQP